MGELVISDNYEIKANGGAIVPPAGSSISIKTQADSRVLINNKPCYFGDVEAVVPAGSTLSGATLVSAVTIKITASGNKVFTDKGNALLINDHSSGLDTGSFQSGSTTTSVPITLVITKAGQTDVSTS